MLDALLIASSMIVCAWFGTALIISKTTPIRQYIIYKKVRPNIEKIIGNWVINEISWNIMRYTNKQYEVFVRISNKDSRTSDFIIVDKNGVILKETLTESIKFWENIR